MRDLFDTISSYIPLSKDLRAALQERMDTHSLKKGSLVHHADQLCKKSYFISSGILRLYFLKDGKEVSEFFCSEKEWINSPRSFMMQEIDEYYIDAIEDTEAYSLHVEDLMYLFEHFPEMERYSRLDMGSMFRHMFTRIVSLRFSSAKEKYDHFAENYSHIQHQIPLGMIASYLGIARETLSRIRRG